MEWNDTLFRVGAGEKDRVGVLVCHGFGGSPRSVQEVAIRLAETGYTVAMPLLTGHGRTPDAMERSRWTDWSGDVEQAFGWLRERSETIFLFGLSMGGTLVIWLAEHHPDVAGLIIVNPVLRHPRERSMRVLGRIGLPRWTQAIGNDAKKAGVDERAYDRIPVRAARQLALLLAAVRRDIVLVRCPALVLSSVIDHVVPPDNRREIFESISSTDKTLIELMDSYHVATMDNEKERILALTLEFIAAHAGG